MKFKLSDKTSRFAKRTLSDFSERMIVMLADMSLEEISVQKICDICNYPRSTFYNYFDDIYDLMDYCWIAIMKDMDIEKYLNIQGEQSTEQIFSLLYDYLDQYRLQICRILLKNNLEGRCMSIVDCIREDKYVFLMKQYLELWCRLISGVFHGLLHNIWINLEQKIADIHFFLPAMERQQVRLAVWRRTLWLVMDRSLMRIIV